MTIPLCLYPYAYTLKSIVLNLHPYVYTLIPVPRYAPNPISMPSFETKSYQIERGLTRTYKVKLDRIRNSTFERD
jgi:hypothetical protein